jgi:hypothetical protein
MILSIILIVGGGVLAFITKHGWNNSIWHRPLNPTPFRILSIIGIGMVIFGIYRISEKDMMQLFLMLGIGLAIIYATLLYLNKGGGVRGGYWYFACMVSFLIHIYLSTRKVLLVIIAIPMLIVAGFVLAIIVGYIKKATGGFDQ